MIQVGIDTGGTFTDFVFLRGHKLSTYKLPSTPHNPSLAIVQGLRDILGEAYKDVEVIHGTTVATNALLERKGARVALITTAGFKDVIEIGRQNRGELYDIFWAPHPPLVESRYRVGVRERIDFRGRVLQKPGTADINALIKKINSLRVDCIAISFLNSYANPRNEELVAKALSKLKLPISVSSKILPEFREYERTYTIITNAYLVPKVNGYMEELSRKLEKSEVSIMQSNGGLLSLGQAGTEPVRTLLSGPAGGVIGGFNIAQKAGFKRIITYDMGGTSTDVSLCDREPSFTTETVIDGIPVKVPMIDVTTIGAGGGSIAYVDRGGALKVGPESAGADPGPACYGNGKEPTVTDANLVLHRLDPTWFLGGRMKLDKKKSVRALGRLSKKLRQTIEQTAEGVIDVANANMERALRVISIGRGYDPRDFALVSFGGAGGLHACELARGLGVKTVIFPRDPGVLSALGMLLADSYKDYSITSFMSSNDYTDRKIERLYSKLERNARGDFDNRSLKYKRYLDLRYKRQSHEITIPYSENFLDVFHRTHSRMYGYMKKENEVEIVTLRLRAIVERKKPRIPKTKAETQKRLRPETTRLIFNGKHVKSALYNRAHFFSGYEFKGPALILEETSTLFVPPRLRCAVDGYSNIIAVAE